MRELEILFFILVALAATPYALYPLFVFLASRLAPRRVETSDATPRVTFVIPACNEEGVIVDKLDNTLALDYPREAFDVIVVSDGSTDGTVAEARRFEGRGVKVIELDENRGKPAAINRAVEESESDVVVLSDASAMLDADALKKLVSVYADASVGAASGMLVPLGSDGVEKYRTFENALRTWESARHSSLGATGALYSFRRELWVPLPEKTVLDDVVIPLRVSLAGKRAVFLPDARVREVERAGMAREFDRKARTLGGNWQAFLMRPRAFVPFLSRVWLGMIGHRLLRVTSPLFLAGAFALNAELVLADGPDIYRVLLVAQAAFYLVLTIPGALGARGPLGWAWTFVAFQLAAVWGFVLFATGNLEKTWRKTAKKRNYRS